MKKMLRNLIIDETGQGLVEYALIVGLIALAAVAFIALSGTSVNTIWESISNRLGDAADLDPTPWYNLKSLQRSKI